METYCWIEYSTDWNTKITTRKILEAIEIALDRWETCYKYIFLPGYHNK